MPLLGASCAHDAAPAAPPESSARVVQIADSSRHWAEYGFAEMVPAILPATTPNARHRTVVMLRIPPETRWRARFSDRQQRHIIAYPPGTRAERLALEYSRGRWRVTDVRGTALLATGEEFRVLRRDSKRAERLVGLAWDRGDPIGQRRATEAIADLACRETDPDTDVGLVRKRNACTDCHVHDKPAMTVELADDMPIGPTDDGGFFQVMNVLRNEAEVDDDRGRDLNAGKKHVRLRCASGPAHVLRSQSGHVNVRCSGSREIPIAAYDLAAALTDGEAHARAVCASRRYLFERADEGARRAFARAFGECRLE